MFSNLVTFDELIRPNLWIQDGFEVELLIKDQICKFPVNKGLLHNLSFGVKKNIVIATYGIRNIIDGFTYVGSTKNIGARLNDHRSGLTTGRHENSKLQQNYNSFHRTDFEVFVIKCNNREEAYDVEQFLLDHFNSIKMCHNAALNARNSRTVPWSIEKIEAARERMKNRTVSQVTKDKLSEALTGRTYTPETQRKMSESARRSASSGERLERLRNLNELRKKKIIVGGVVYNSILEASRQLSIKDNVINYRLNSLSPRFINWKYLE